MLSCACCSGGAIRRKRLPRGLKVICPYVYSEGGVPNLGLEHLGLALAYDSAAIDDADTVRELVGFL